jgi:hypothetical protein
MDQILNMNFSQTWTVLIEKREGWMGIGICHPEIILKNQY